MTEKSRGYPTAPAHEALEDLIDDYRYDLDDVEEVEGALREDPADGWVALVNGLIEAGVEVAPEDIEKLRDVAEILEIDDDRLDSF